MNIRRLLDAATHHKVFAFLTDPGLLYSVYSNMKNVNTVVLDCSVQSSPEALCLHSVACCTHYKTELDM